MLNESKRKSNNSYLSLKTLYEENITVKSIAQELEFCHNNDLAKDIQKALEKRIMIYWQSKIRGKSSGISKGKNSVKEASLNI